mmetsp:Transcript_8493/g.24349  ORF Transcript_8493/g.24349 Transcript_8493/m.24349 type:complete len:239 (+) Transcript_8493:1123-1839(+)
MSGGHIGQQGGGIHNLLVDSDGGRAAGLQQRHHCFGLPIVLALRHPGDAPGVYQLLQHGLVVSQDLVLAGKIEPAGPQAPAVDAIEGCGLVEADKRVRVYPMAARLAALVHQHHCRVHGAVDKLVHEGHGGCSSTDDEVVTAQGTRIRHHCCGRSSDVRGDANQGCVPRSPNTLKGASCRRVQGDKLPVLRFVPRWSRCLVSADRTTGFKQKVPALGGFVDVGCVFLQQDISGSGVYM